MSTPPAKIYKGLYRDHIGVIYGLYRGYFGIIENKLEATILGFRVLGLGLR